MTAYERLLDRFRELGRTVKEDQPGRHAMVSCPGPIHKHGDRKPSLSIRSQPGRVRLHCFPGCPDVDILAAMGMEVRDLFDDRKEVRYPYEDEWTVHRSWDAKIGEKTITQTHPKPKGQRPKTSQLYRLSEVKVKVADGWTILLLEGEDNADLINSLPEEERGQVFATSARMGAYSFHLCDVEPLRGAQAIAVVDRDESGDGWARQVRTKVQPLAASLVFKKSKVDEEKADAADHIMHGYSLDQLEPYLFPPSQLLAGVRNFGWLGQQTFGPLQWVIPGILPESYTLLVGAPKIGKSWLALSIALAISSGGYMFGQYCGRPRPVLLLALEDSDRRLQSRKRTLDPESDWPALLDYHDRVAHDQVIATIVAWLEERARKHPGSSPVVILDTVGKVIPNQYAGESQYNRDYRFSSYLQSITTQWPGMALIGLHHDRKANTDDFVESVSGTNGVARAADSILMIRRPRGESEGLLLITGRDVEHEGEYGVKFNGGKWDLIGKNLREAAKSARIVHATAGLGDRQTEIVEYIADHPEGVRAADVAEEFAGDITPGEVRVYLTRLYDTGRIARPSRGLYTPIASVTTVTSESNKITEVTGGIGNARAHTREAELPIDGHRRYGTCTNCGREMLIFQDDQTTHPACA